MNTKIKKVYVHIGVPKSGSSSLQMSLLKSRGILKELEGGFLYPKISYFHHGRLINHMFSDELPIPRVYLRRFHGNRREYEQYIYSERKRFEAEIENSDCENLIISGEQISRLKFDIIKRLQAYLNDLAPNAEITIVICTREHTSRFASAVQQNVKVGKVVDLVRKMNKDSNYYQRRLSDFIKVFGRDKIIVYPFEDIKKYTDGPIGMFFSNIGVNTAGFNLVNVKSNEGYSDLAVDIVSYINNILPMISGKEVTHGREFFDVRSLGRLSGSKYKLTEETIITMHEAAKADKIWLRDHLGIDYTDLYSKKNATEVVFGPSYVHEFKCIFVELNPVIKKLSYDYINEKRINPSVDGETRSKCEEMVAWMNSISGEFKANDLDFFLMNHHQSFNISTTMKAKSSLYFARKYYQRAGLKKSIRRALAVVFK